MDKDGLIKQMDRIVELNVFMAELQDEVAYVSQRWESGLTYFGSGSLKY